ncbi:tartrate dehydrogenase [Fusarium mexicanum]|uniref:Tartrate dehydrogenase n=1 Tax=Fusarium mexicanum TaxID=751941 RepID=A0A8H5N6P0_9HYPO|nr:tartrate dehydrogenase [Fusarium mexicanum]
MMTLRRHKIATIPGDGIGVDVMEATIQLLQALEDVHKTFTLDIETLDWSSKNYLNSGTYIPESAWRKLKACDAILFGAVGSPVLKDVPDDISLWKLVLPLRKRLNHGGEYAGQGGVSHEDTPDTIANEVAVFTRTAIERTMHFAFEVADSRPRKNYPQVKTDKMLVDAMTVRMVLKPQSLDTVVATNLHGDILSDLVAALADSIGIAPSSNLDPTRKFPSMFEPIYGSAPDIIGIGIANPLATF